MANAKRNRLTDAYSAVRDATKARMLAGKADPVEQIPQGYEKTAPKTRDIRAKASGSNAKYIDLAYG